MSIRVANINDLTAIKVLVKSGLQEFGFTYRPMTAESDLENFQAEYLGNNGLFLILESEEKEILGCGGLKFSNGNNTFKIRKMYVAERNRGCGYGALILKELILIVKKRKGKEVVLETSTLMTAAIKLYQKHGFVVVDNKPVSPRCDLTMIKRINDDAITEK